MCYKISLDTVDRIHWNGWLRKKNWFVQKTFHICMLRFHDNKSLSRLAIVLSLLVGIHSIETQLKSESLWRPLSSTIYDLRHRSFYASCMIHVRIKFTPQKNWRVIHTNQIDIQLDPDVVTKRLILITLFENFIIHIVKKK